MFKLLLAIIFLNRYKLLYFFLMALLTYSIYYYYKISSVHINSLDINLESNEVKVDEIKMIITYNPKGDDNVYTSISATPIIDSGNLLIHKHEGMKPLFKQFLHVGYRESNYYELFSFKESASFSQDYSFNLFGKSSTEIISRIFITYQGQGETLPKVRININNISNIFFYKIFPEPDEYNTYFIEYNDPKKAKGILSHGITLYGTDITKRQSNQNYIFIFGLIIGTLLSLIAAIILDKVKRN